MQEDNNTTNSVDSTETKQYELPICGITGKPLEWGQRTWISTYVKGKKEVIPLYLDIEAVRALHRQSPTYIAKKGNQDTQQVENQVNMDDLVEEEVGV